MFIAGSRKSPAYERGEKNMQNKDSETGMAEDLLRSIVQLGAAEIHLQTLYNKSRAELENGLVDVDNNDILQKQLKKVDNYRDEINSIAELRRREMRYLYNIFQGNKDAWCLIKHLGIAMMTAFEAYEASDDDPNLLDMYFEANKEFVKAVTDFCGMEITDCAACMSDYLKGDNNGK